MNEFNGYCKINVFETCSKVFLSVTQDISAQNISNKLISFKRKLQPNEEIISVKKKKFHGKIAVVKLSF